jgi:predicted RecB family nuclease
MERHGDPEGVAGRVRQNLLDLLPIARDSVLLPLSSYSLKEVEKYVGFKRSQTEYGGSWSIAKYIEATETRDEDSRNKLVGEILIYNQEDLAATWAVFEWLQAKAS